MDANTCGGCRHYDSFTNEPRGECYFNPPSVDYRGVKVRPPVKASDRACGQFAAGIPTTTGKVNPETPGQAAKAARSAKSGR